MARTLTGLFCFAVALSWCVASADAYSISVVGLESTGPSSILEVDIILDSEDQALYGYIMRVYFDPTLLSVVSGTYHPIAGEALSSLRMYPDYWYITMTAWVATGPVHQPVATFVFHVMDVPSSTWTSIVPIADPAHGGGILDPAGTIVAAESIPLSIHVSDCGDGMIVSPEQCDDDGTTPGDGCDETCQVETGWTCLGEPSVCNENCGDGIIVGSELCDDNGTTPGDGCDETCQVETGWDCLGEPSVCSGICGDEMIVGAELCDDGGTTPDDGCDETCQVETGWTCLGQPSVCSEDCGDGMIVGSELCDDNGTTTGDGCDETCRVETGWTCLDQPSVCSEDCGDGMIVGAELCDDGGTTPDDGCDATCRVETGWDCLGQPSICTFCGDGVIEGIEACDDGGTASGDGCRASCQIESDWRCVGEPSACTKMLPALSPWSQVALVACLLMTTLGVWRRRGASPSAA